MISPIFLFASYFQKPFFAYFLFFSISISSILGLTESLTGAYAESTTPALFGLSFYSASLAFLIYQHRLSKQNIIYSINPLLLTTGPIALYVRKISYKKINNRINYYLPFITLGIFLNQAISIPLTETFYLINEVDLVSSIIFALIFELFVYANFCGLSLVIYGISGILGYKIPLNFRQPFSSNNMRDFWKGWHVTLSITLKTLFYDPSKSLFNSKVAIFTVFISSAMWHGVSLNFLFWGIFHGCIFLATIFLLKKNVPILPIFLMILGITIGRMIFADSDMERLLLKLQFQFVDFSSLKQLFLLSKTTILSLFVIVVFVISEFLFRKHKYFSGRNYKFYRLPFIREIILIFTLFFLSSNLGFDYAVYGQR